MRLSLMLMAIAPAARAQTGDPGRDEAPVRVGALGLNPTLSITNVGLDTNVFYSPDQPESDYTATVSPATGVWFQTGRARFEGASRVDAVFFKQFADQGTFSTINSGRVDFALNRFRPYIMGSFLHVNDRPDAVIDARVRRTEATAGLGTAFTVTPKVFLTIAAEGSTVGFGRKGSPISATLDEQLKRRLIVTSAGVQYLWSPLTTMLVDVQQERTRFASAGERNATGLRITSGLDLKRRALVSGRVRVGYFRYRPQTPQIPAFTGVTAAVDLRWRLFGNTIVGEFDRDLFYAGDSDAYYLQTRFGLGATRELNRALSLTASVSQLRLSYSAASGVLRPPAAASTISGAASVSLANLLSTSADVFFARPDRVIAATAGVSLRLTPTVGFGFSGMYAYRSAVLPSGRYADVRLMANITYALH